MSFPDKEARILCWSSRDRYWECLDANPKNPEACAALRKKFESGCSSQWVKHFDRKRDYQQYKERIIKDGYEPLNEN